MQILAPFTSILMASAGASSTDGIKTRRVFVSGAGGQTGQLVFRKLLAKRPTFEPIGIVRTEQSKASLLESGDVPSENVIVADITDADSVKKAMDGCDAAMICTSAKPAPTGETDEETGRPVFGFPNGQPEEVDWIGQKNQIDAVKACGSSDSHVVLCSSMGGTDPNNSLNKLGRTTKPDGTVRGGDILLWKRKAEKYLIDSGLPYTIIHPGGLLNEPGGKRSLVLGVDDAMVEAEYKHNSVPREDVAEMMVQALLNPDVYKNRSFDLRSKPEGDGTPTTDFVELEKEYLDGRNCDYSLGKVGGE